MATFDDLSLVSNGRELSGWTRIRVTRGIARMPSDFDIEMSDGHSVAEHALVVKPGDPCQIMLGNQPVITGYIDQVIPFITPNRHGIRLVGRGKCADLVDCSAVVPKFQISSASVLSTIRLLASTYDITVNTTEAKAAGFVVPQQNILFGETVFEVIDRNCGFAALLAYDQPDGSLLLSRVGTKNVGALDARHIERGSYAWSANERFSEYRAKTQSMSVLSDVSEAGFKIYTVTDPAVKRTRIRYVIVDSVASSAEMITLRTKWEANRRVGRSHVLNLRVDTWRGPDGNLWEPNTLVSIDPFAVPGLKLEILERKGPWVLGEVTYNRDNDHGTTADLSFTFPDSYSPEPVMAYPQYADVVPLAKLSAY